MKHNYLFKLAISSLLLTQTSPTQAYFTEGEFTFTPTKKQYDQASLDLDQNSDLYNIDMTAYFKNVEIDSIPHEQAAFLNKAGFVHLNYQQDTLENRNALAESFKNKETALELKTILKGHLILGLNHIDTDIDPAATLTTLQRKQLNQATTLSIGSYIGSRQEIVVQLTRSQYHENPLIEADTLVDGSGYAINYKGVYPMGQGGKSLSVAASLLNADIEDNQKTDIFGLDLDIAFYFTHRIGLHLETGFYDEDRKGSSDYFDSHFNIGVNYFIYDYLSLQGKIINRSFRGEPFSSDSEKGSQDGLELGFQFRL